MAYKVENLTLTRSGTTYSASWKTSSAFRSNCGKGIRITFKVVNTNNVESLVGTYDVSKTATSQSMTISRTGYYPAGGQKLKYVKVYVAGKYYSKKKKKTVLRSSVCQTISLSNPAEPLDHAMSFSQSDHKLSVTGSVVDSERGGSERYDTCISISRYDNFASKKWVGVYDRQVSTSTGSGSVSATYDGETRWALVPTDPSSCIIYESTIRNRGLHGDTSTTKKCYVGFPDKPAITGYSISGTNAIVRFNVHHSSYGGAGGYSKPRPVDEVCLQVAYSDMDYAPTASSAWADLGAITGNEYTNALIAAKSLFDVDSNIGKRIYVRVKSTNNLGADYAQYSNAIRIKEFEVINPRGAAAANVISVASVTPGTNGTSLKVKCQWAANSQYNATRLSWSTDPDAWDSTEEPTTFELKDDAWASGNSCEVFVTGLDEATVYYFRARRYSTQYEGQQTQWSKRTDGTSTSDSAAGVTLSAAPSAAKNEPLTVSWVVGGTRPQAAWAVFVDGNAIAKGDGEDTAYTIPGNLLSGTSATVKVQSSLGGAMMESNSVTVALYDKPTATITAANVASTPYTFTVAASEDAACAISITSNGVVGMLPDRREEQAAGEVVWATSAAPGTITVPRSVRLIDQSWYTISVTPQANGLTGDTVTAVVKVDLTHQAAAPTLAIVPDAEKLQTVITVTAPEGAAATDVCDLYHITPNGYELCMDSIALGSTVVDEYAPFTAFTGTVEGEEYDWSMPGYRAVLRTVDGDRDWQDYNYSLSCKDIVVDFGGSMVRLPYDPSISVTPGKLYESVQYLDGSVAGHWSYGGTLRVSIGASTIKGIDAESQSQIQRLGEYAGSSYLRTPAGHALECNINVSSVSYGTNGSVPVAFEAERLALAEYVAKPYVAADEAAETEEG